MLKKQFRLKKKSAFNATYKIKNSTHKGGVALFVGIMKNEQNINLPTKVGFVVSKKTHKRAVKRNRLKRLMRESFRLLQKDNDLGNSQQYLSLIFTGHSSALGKSFKEIQKNVKFLISNLK